ncbi:hypothetical protein AVEN_40376-1 [Araneus ventricosus]|uniref:Uncharacterized protein n=1 Tax=Araneus ventricosus TaxID=182803 RepID=A0A4Y2IQA5_ARAVE|nr:hypothetical protein AVEN_40376-1 [Araneus ventricosus]
MVNKQYHFKVTFGSSNYSYCRQCRYLISFSPQIVPLCRNFHLSPRPSAFLLAAFYLTHVLALLKCRTFICSMEPKISNSDAFECFPKGLMWLEQQTDSDSTQLMLLKQLRGRVAKRRQSCL